ncbi:MAG: BCD family MFS transporter [Myxococcaceae bacterium]|nr:BCD family MFS transporter [Myxococcaceae bacterium]
MNEAKVRRFSDVWRLLGPKVLPFADAASVELPLLRLLRLSLFQVSVGMSLVLLNGTLNRVMIVELGVPTWLVALLVALPVVFAPVRALIGFRSDRHRSVLGWRRVPYIWMGTLIQFGGFAILPFALLVLSGRGALDVPYAGEAATALAFLMVGAGLHTAQTAGVALATDLAPADTRPRVVALLYVMLLLGMVVSSLTFGALLRDFDPIKLIKVVQGAAVATMALNLLALWKQEPRRLGGVAPEEGAPDFRTSYRTFMQGGPASRLLVAVGLGAAGFNMQDILLEPYGGAVLGLPVSATTTLTALMAGATLVGLFLAARWLQRGSDPHGLAARGALVGIVGFSAVIFSAPLESLALFLGGTACIGFGGGWFSVGTLTAAMSLSDSGQSGLAIGAWGAVQATVAGLGTVLAGALRDGLGALAGSGALGPGLVAPWLGYSFVYHLEIALLFGTLVALGPLVRAGGSLTSSPQRFGLAELPN